ncbi:MAG: hypothetical protein CM1200mP9_05760 [Gammaproteobacteria bacterium]|nr:MAG: hypothetical protein CM1200mP9_05760 [Gammaproteobacteria bacterium]
MEPIEKQLSIRGINVTYYEWGMGGETTSCSSRDGFHPGVLGAPYEIWGGTTVWALDMRGHGRSDNFGPYEWSISVRRGCFTRQWS